MFYSQIILKKEMPFELRLPSAEPTAFGGMTREQIDIELQKGMVDIAAGCAVSADEVDTEMKSLYGL